MGWARRGYWCEFYLIDGPHITVHSPDRRLSRCSRALYAFAHYPDLWKALVLTSLSEGHAALPAEQRYVCTRWVGVGWCNGLIDRWIDIA